MNFLAQSPEKIANDLADKLSEYFSNRPLTPAFFSLPGQDPVAYELPSQSLCAAYWQGDRTQQQCLVDVLLDLAGRRAEILPLEALQTLLITVGAISRPEALLPFVRVLGARTDLGQETFNLFGTALQVAKGFGPIPNAWDAVYEMVGFQSFPEKLVFDAFDICVVDTRSAWSHRFERLEPAMMRITNVSRRVAMGRRIEHTAQNMAKRLSPINIERGLKTLFGKQALKPQNQEWLRGQSPRHMLATQLLLAPSAPLSIHADTNGNHFLIRADISPSPRPKQSAPASVNAERVFSWLTPEPDEDELLAA